MSPKLISLLTSRKFWAALFSLGLLSVKNFAPNFPIDETQITNMTYVMVAYILGTALDNRTTPGILINAQPTE